MRVTLRSALALERVEAHRLQVEVVGEPGAVAEAVRAWAEQHASAGDSTGKSLERTRTAFSVDGASVRWREHDGAEPLVEVTGATADRVNDVVSGAFEEAKVRTRRFALDVERGSAQLDRTGRVEHARATKVALAIAGEPVVVAAREISSADPSPPPVPGAALGPAGRGSDPTTALRVPLPHLATLRIAVATACEVASKRLSESARAEVDSLALAVGEGARMLAVGRGPLGLVRHGDAVELSFSTQHTDSGTPLSLTASLPLKTRDASVSFSGGPLSLALLGFDEGALGLVDVDRATVTARGRVALAGEGGALTFDVEAGVRSLAINRPSFAAETLRGVDATLLARGAMSDGGGLRLDDAEVSLGALHVAAHGSAEGDADHLAGSFGFEVPKTSCEALLQSMPAALVPTLDGAEMDGTFGARGKLVFDSRAIDDLVLDWKTDDGCSMTLVPEALARERFLEPFEHTVYLPDGTLGTETTGPTTDDWTPLDRISPYMQVAVLTTEDGAFYRHHGFNRAAIRNALVADLKAGRFLRGASTITMQLAKNLFLFRDKTLSRKLEEIILADYAEQVFSKKELMELYLNVIEFGPDLYGIGKAAFHYFGRKPDELNVAECFFLASLLPAPLRYGKLADKPRLSENWTNHLRQWMGIAAKNDLLSPEELTQALSEEVVFHDPKDPLPPPRPSVAGTHFVPPTSDRAEPPSGP